MAAVAALAPILSAAGSLFGALQKAPQPTVYQPPAVNIPEIPSAPQVAQTATFSSVVDTEQTKLDKKRRLALLEGGSAVNSLTTRFTPIQSSTSQNTLLGD